MSDIYCILIYYFLGKVARLSGVFATIDRLYHLEKILLQILSVMKQEDQSWKQK
ncbi:hypothetical protein [Dapis sp. BLCC M229]|uniref:hypothetical protein n=1 Tax=Dapis sp. BLCC M229 TaxID=3400188 RepID=UPI003CEA80CD